MPESQTGRLLLVLTPLLVWILFIIFFPDQMSWLTLIVFVLLGGWLIAESLHEDKRVGNWPFRNKAGNRRRRK